MLLYGERGFAEAGHRSDKTAAMAALKSGALKLPKLELSNMKAYVYGAAANRDRNVRPRRNVRRTCAGGDDCIYRHVHPRRRCLEGGCLTTDRVKVNNTRCTPPSACRTHAVPPELRALHASHR